MSEVPSCTGIPETDVLRLHASPGGLKSNREKNLESVFDDSSASLQEDVSFDSDTSGLYFPPSKKKSNNLRYSGDNEYSSDEGSCKIGENELSVELDSLVSENFQRSPYLLRSSLSRSVSPEPSTSGETEAIADTSSDETKKGDGKKKRKSLGPKDFIKAALPDKASGVVFTKMFKPPEPCSSTFPLHPIVEFDEETTSEDRPSEPDRFPMDNQQQTELTSNGVVEDPYVLNINVHIPKEFSDKDIPVIVNIKKQCNYSYQEEDDGSSNNVSSVSSGVGSFGDDIGDIRNSTLVIEEEEPNALLTLDQPVETISEEIPISEEPPIIMAPGEPRVAPVPVKQPIATPLEEPIAGAPDDQVITETKPEDSINEARLDDLFEANLEATLPIAVKIEKVEEDLNNPKPGPSQPKPASRKNSKADAPKKTNAKKTATDKKTNSDKKARTKKSQEDKSAENEAIQTKAKQDKSKLGKAQQGKVQQDKVQQGKVQQGKAQPGKNQKAPDKAIKRAKEIKKKKKQRSRKELERCRCAHTKAKRRRHPKLHKRNKKCRGRVVKFACRHKHSDSSSDSDSSDCCSVCSGEFCRSSDSSSSSSESCSCCDSTSSSSCSCSCCEHSSDSDYDSSS